MGVQVPPRTRQFAHAIRVESYLSADDAFLGLVRELEAEIAVDLGLSLWSGEPVGAQNSATGCDLGFLVQRASPNWERQDPCSWLYD
jgi:hypothetical protein